jgi:DNA-binding NarL/FixJ family response regulator
MKINIGLADDHQLFLRSLSMLIDSIPEFDIVIEALNGKELITKLATAETLPDIILIDVNMPLMDGVQTVMHINSTYPTIKMIALSMKSDDLTIINMLKAGSCSYLLKDIHPDELERALYQVYSKGYYNGDSANINYRRLIKHSQNDVAFNLSEKEKIFLKLACSDLTYKHIALEMKMAERTIDGYREALFQKLNVQSRVGMALEAIRRNLVSLE